MIAPGNNDTRYEVITQEDPDSGDLLLPLPQPLLDQMGWKEGDELLFDIDDTGAVIIRKAPK